MKTNSRLIPVLAIPTSFGYQLKLKEAPGSKYQREQFPGGILRQDSYYALQLEDMGQDKQQEYPELIAEVMMNEDELLQLFLGLTGILRDKGLV